MSHEWHRGVLTTSSWHGLENIGAMPDAGAMIPAAWVQMAQRFRRWYYQKVTA